MQVPYIIDTLEAERIAATLAQLDAVAVKLRRAHSGYSEQSQVNHVAKSATTATSGGTRHGMLPDSFASHALRKLRTKRRKTQRLQGYSSDFTQYTSGLSNSVAMPAKLLEP